MWNAGDGEVELVELCLLATGMFARQFGLGAFVFAPDPRQIDLLKNARAGLALLWQRGQDAQQTLAYFTCYFNWLLKMFASAVSIPP